MDDLSNIILYVNYSILILSFTYGTTKSLHLKHRSTRWFIGYLSFVIALNILTEILILGFEVKNTRLSYPFYVTGEFFILEIFLVTALKVRKIWSIIITLIACCFFIETLILWLVFDDPTIGFSKSISNIIIVITVAFILVKNLKELEGKNPFLPLYAALFFYYAASIFLFLIMNQLTESTSYIWSINNVMSSVLYGSSIYTFYQLRKLY